MLGEDVGEHIFSRCAEYAANMDDGDEKLAVCIALCNFLMTETTEELENVKEFLGDVDVGFGAFNL
jgi:hypothetical protein